MAKQTLSSFSHSQTDRPRHSSRKVYIAVWGIIIQILITMEYEESFATLPEGDIITQLLKKSFAARNVRKVIPEHSRKPCTQRKIGSVGVKE